MVQRGRAFTRGPLPLNPQTLFSAQGTPYAFFLTDPKVEMDRCAVFRSSLCLRGRGLPKGTLMNGPGFMSVWFAANAALMRKRASIRDG